MFDQLTWSIGMFTLTACVLFSAGYLMRHRGVLDLHSRFITARKQQISRRNLVLSVLAVVGVYILEIAILHWAYAENDSTALDWAAAVPMLGCLVLPPLAGVLAVTLIVLIRLNLSFLESADSATLANYNGNGLWNLDPHFWQEELWLWLEPGVVLILLSGLASVLVCWFWRAQWRQEYPLWLGIPLALVAQGAYTMSAITQWGQSSGLAYLQNEALPAGIGQALATTVLIISLRAAAAARQRARANQAEWESAQHQIRHLNAQIAPHFLNNSLNAVAAVMSREPDRARALLESLALHCRAKCDASSSLITLSDEMTLVRCYLDIECARMGSRLVIEEQLATDCNKLLLPQLVIQPLVENAIQHGLGRCGGTGRICIRATREGDQLVVSVVDSGDGLMKELTTDHYGTGLSNVHSRMRHFYKDGASLVIGSTWGVGTTASLRLPAMTVTRAGPSIATRIAA